MDLDKKDIYIEGGEGGGGGGCLEPVFIWKNQTNKFNFEKKFFSSRHLTI